MNAITFVLDLLKYVLAGLMVAFAVWYFIKSYLDKTHDFKLLELQKSTQSQTLPLRLQAYERIILFLERINPANMLVRLHVSGMTAREMHNIILSDIRNEYQHNISQQLYVSNASWAIVKKIKEDTITLVNSAVQSLPEHASAVDLSKSILTHLAGLEEENPYDAALTYIKRDVQQLF